VKTLTRGLPAVGVFTNRVSERISYILYIHLFWKFISMNEKAWVEQHIPTQLGKTIIITGANSGLGLEAAKVLTAKDAHVVLACRNPLKAVQAVDSIMKDHPQASVEIMELNLADLSSVHDFAQQVREKFKGIDVLVNNAGVMALPYSRTTDGFEMQLGTNHFGHFALTALLFPILKNTSGSRVVNVSSIAHWMGKLDFDNLNYEKGGYRPWPAYYRSKLANALFTFELNRKIKEEGLNLTVVTSHPGYSATNLQMAGMNSDNKPWKKWIVSTGNKLFATSALFGALPTLYAATKDLNGGEYIGPGKLFNTRGTPGINPSSRSSRNPELAKRLWDVSEELTRVSFPLNN
jgi:NAD(P)-dependent dehydrogenase (short-subunit alcohol dehydrogenase family)